MRRILVDVSLIARGDAHTGIQRVVRGILRHLLTSPPTNVQVIPVRAGRWLGYRYAGDYGEKLAGGRDFPSGRVQASARDVFLALDLAPSILPRHRRQLEQWKHAGAGLWFFLHDLFPLTHPHWFTAAGARNFARWIECVSACADGVICATNAVASEFRQRFGGNRKIALECVPLGADIEATSPSSGLPDGFRELTDRLSSAPAVLVVGRIEPRKGHAQALSAFEILWREGVPSNLVILGNAGWKVDELVQRLRRHPENGRRLFWLEGASDEALEKLYELAHGVLLPSQGEGFGLPLVEAARHAKPILARDIPAYREIARDHAHFFAGTDADSLAGSLRSWLRSIQQGAAPSSAHIQTLTWAQSARRLCEVLLRDAACGEKNAALVPSSAP